MSGLLARVPLRLARRLRDPGSFYTAVRYRPVVREIGRCRAGTVLEVGSGNSGLAAHAVRPIFGLDRSAGVPCYPHLCRIRGDAGALPFRDRSFDLVCAIDVLEHLPGQTRLRAVCEMMRVCATALVIAVPSGMLATTYERDLQQRSRVARARSVDPRRRARIAGRTAYLDEHAEHGLPEVGEIERYVLESAGRLGRVVRVAVVGNEPIWVWQLSALGHMGHSTLRTVVTTLLLMLFSRPIARLRPDQPYRTVFVVESIAARAPSDAEQAMLDRAEETP